MTNQELYKLRSMIKQEINKRERINSLLEKEDVKEFIQLLNINISPKEINRLKIMEKIIFSFKPQHSNNIWILVGVKRFQYSSDEERDWDSSYFSFDSALVNYKVYQNIETKLIKYAIISRKGMFENSECELSSEFEKGKIVLNPYNISDGDNGFEEIRNEFFLDSIKYGQPKAKQRLLKKYQPIK